MCEQLCNQGLYFRNITAPRAVEILSDAQQLTLNSDYDGPIRFLVRQGVAFDAIENFEENIGKKFQKYDPTINFYDNDPELIGGYEEDGERNKRSLPFTYWMGSMVSKNKFTKV